MKKYKYIHYVSYMSRGGIGILELSSDWKIIDTKSKIDTLTKMIKQKNPNNPIIQSILTVKNE